jgi:hypothetical protein
MNNSTSRKVNNISLAKIGKSDDSGNYNTLLMTLLVVGIVFLILLMFLSKKFRVSRTLNSMDIYIKFQNIQSMKVGLLKDYKLCDFYVSSSFNTALSGTQLCDYVSSEMVKKVLQTGVRFLEFQVFGDQYGKDAQPVVSSGYRKGEWKLSLNTLYLEEVFKTIRDHAFRIYDGTDGSPNNLDPLFISLDLKTNYNYFVNNKIQKLFTTYFMEYLLDPSYNYQAKNIGMVPLSELMGKVIIFSSDGFQGSTLEELVNYSWIFSKMKRYHYTELDDQIVEKTPNDTLDDITQKKIDNSIEVTKNLIEFNQISKFNLTGLTIVYPHKEGDILTSNYDPTTAWNLGCQFVSMNFQKMDLAMDKYINKFRNKAFVLKPQSLRN